MHRLREGEINMEMGKWIYGERVDLYSGGQRIETFQDGVIVMRVKGGYEIHYEYNDPDSITGDRRSHTVFWTGDILMVFGD